MRHAAFGIRLFLFLALGSFAVAAQAQVVRTWVSTAGVDNPSCSRSSPCRTFGAAIAAVDSGGEVAVLDSGGYGAFSVTKAVTVLAPAGIHAAVAPTAGTAVTINAPGTDEVRLVNLQLIGRGAYAGIEVSGGKRLSIENCTIAGFTYGISVSEARTSVAGSRILSNSGYGVYATGIGSVMTLVVAGSHFEGNDSAIYAANYTRTMISDSVVTSNGTGISVGGNFSGSADLSVVGSNVSMNSDRGLYIGGSGATLTPSATMRLSDNEIIGNNVGVYFFSNSSTQSVVLSRGNNTINGNGIDVFNGTLSTFSAR